MTSPRLWTGTGDDGTTGLLYGGRMPKGSARAEAIGAVDEAQAAIGFARAHAQRASELDLLLIKLERDLWVLMAELATDDANRHKLEPDKSAVTAAMVRALEAFAEEIASRFSLPAEFVVPGQDPTSAALDVARTVVRRAERAAVAVAAGDAQVVPYLNRLSSVLWILARWTEGQSLPTRS